MVKADDFGCYHGNIKIIKCTCFPLKADDIKDKQLIDWINELITSGLIFTYTSEDGKQYIKLTKWEKHQQKRAKNSKFPLPQADDINCNQLQPNVPEKRETRNEKREYENAEPPVQKIVLSEFKNVKLSEEEKKKLYERFGQFAIDEAIEEFGGWMKENGKTKKDHYAALINWIKRNQDKKPKEIPKFDIEEWAKT